MNYFETPNAFLEDKNIIQKKDNNINTNSNIVLITSKIYLKPNHAT